MIEKLHTFFYHEYLSIRGDLHTILYHTILLFFSAANSCARFSTVHVEHMCTLTNFLKDLCRENFVWDFMRDIV